MDSLATAPLDQQIFSSNIDGLPLGDAAIAPLGGWDERSHDIMGKFSIRCCGLEAAVMGPCHQGSLVVHYQY